jgi:beta-lactamase regulating signal transducer with metallopeptidase domain
MNPIEMLLDKPIFQALGWTLIHFIWQGAIIAVLYVFASVLLRRFSANIRYTAACVAMLLMLVAPAATLIGISAAGDNPPAAVPAAETTQSSQTLEQGDQITVEPLISEIRSDSETASAEQPISTLRWAQAQLPRVMPWLLALWFAGVFFLSLRFAGGWVMVQRLKRTEASPSLDHWQTRLASLSHRLRVSRPVRLCESALVEVPTVIGWLRPVILLPASALTGLSAEQLEALLAHELAHIRRYDYLVNLLQTSIETLFFYHPAVWWVSAQVRHEREHCCDDLAVVACGDVLTYAHALTTLEHLRGSEPQLAVAASGGSLLVRVQRLLRGRAPAFYGFESGFAGFLALATILMLLAGAETALLSRSAKAAVKDAGVMLLSEMVPLAADQPAHENPTSRVEPRSADRVVAPPVAASSIDAADVAPEANGPAVTGASHQDVLPSGPQDFGSEMAAVGLTNLNGRQLVALQSNGVTAQFVREISGLPHAKLTVERIVAMRIHGVTAAFAEELKGLGLQNLSVDQLITFRIHGVTSQYITELKNAGYANTSPDYLVAFRIHGVTPAFIQQMSDLGFASLSADQLAACGIHGVTPLFVQTMRSFIRGKLRIDDLLGLRIQGVTPEMIKELEIMGYSNLTASQLTAFRIHGVTPRFIRSIQDSGYDRITADQLTELRIFGVTPEFIELVKSRGFSDVTLHQLVELRRLNILPSAKTN